MRQRKKWFLLFIALAISGVALAKWQGAWYCAACTDNTAGAFASGETYLFIYTDVNQKVDSWMAGNEPGTVTICNGSVCAGFKYVPLSGQFKYTGSYRSTWKGQPGGAAGSGPPPGGGAVCSTCQVHVGDPENADN